MIRNKTVVETASDRDFEVAFTKVAADAYASKLKPSLFAATEVGNMYTASVYACLVSFLAS
jgi:hydroxymethylglutaryl-CoA synthase